MYQSKTNKNITKNQQCPVYWLSWPSFPYISQTKVCQVLLLLFSFWIGGASAQSLLDYAAVPNARAGDSPPLIMLAMSRDEQLWHKAYPDYTDLDEDGTLDTTYIDSFEYYGYFDSNFCYEYKESGKGVYSPIGRVSNGHKCDGAWSGNFMNWLTMTRMDIVRKVLYGGFRVVDDVNNTILQRALIPSDNHAYAKVVKDSELAKRDSGSIADYTPITNHDTLTFCNVTDTGRGATRHKSVIDYPPLLKVAPGDHFVWSFGERHQCQFTDQASKGNRGDEEWSKQKYSVDRPTGNVFSQSYLKDDAQMEVRVAVCVKGLDRTNCRSYVDDRGVKSYKPVGSLQNTGELYGFRFGLITGSYNNNTKGGVLRKNITLFGDQDSESNDIEVNPHTGQFRKNTPSDRGGIGGIVDTIDTLRIQGWNNDGEFYDDCNYWAISVDEFLGNNDYKCRDWGNPIAEIYLEALRYFAGKGKTNAFSADDSDLLPNLKPVTWKSPYDDETICSDCFIVVLSTGLNNFDGDNLSSANVLEDLDSVAKWTKKVGDDENISGTNRVVGSANGGTNGTCNAEVVGDLSQVSGLCPEQPKLRGTYNIAGLAYYARTNNINPDKAGNEVKVNTYTVSLAEALPNFTVTASNSNTVQFSPTCKAVNDGDPYNGGNWQPCSLVDVIVQETNEFYGRYLIGWENASWGSDNDQDGVVVYEYCTATTMKEREDYCEGRHTDDEAGDNYPDHFLAFANYPDDNEPNKQQWEDRWPGDKFSRKPDWKGASGDVQIRMSWIGGSAGMSMKYGYVMNGSNGGDQSYEEEIIRHGHYNFVTQSLSPSEGEAGRTLWSNEVQVFVANGAAPSLQNPLWYAAKYGAFEEKGKDSNGIPDQLNEWDKMNNFTQVNGPDGLPDGYFPVKNPSRLEGSLKSAFERIANSVGSGSSAAVVSNSGSGQGAIYQAVYSPRIENDLGEVVTWVGALHAVYLDSYGQLREDDGDIPGELDQNDSAIIIEYIAPKDDEDNDIEEEAKTFVRRFSVDANGKITTAEKGIVPLIGEEFTPIWQAQEALADVKNYVTNRSYSTAANLGRYIFTGIDGDDVDDGEIILGNKSSAVKNARSNTLDDGVFNFSADFFASGNLYRYLGTDNIDDARKITNYIRGEEFPEFRPRVLADKKWLLGDIVHASAAVVGAPQELYHLEFIESTYGEYVEAYKNRRTVVYAGSNGGMLHAFNGGFFQSDFNLNLAYKLESAAGGETQHPLGSELWAYVPNNLLPHLQWLTLPDYPHVYYMDGVVQSYDVKIFDGEDDAIYPGGWGTIIVAGMRLGGGDYSFDHDDNPSTEDITTRSAYVIFDVTDPESPPKLIAELPHPELGFTSSIPTLVKQSRGGADNSADTQNVFGDPEEWYLVFGSGPSGTGALRDGTSNQNAKLFVFDLVKKNKLKVIETNEENSFVGGLTAADWDLDFADDAIYFGTVGSTEEEPVGQIKRVDITGSLSALGNDTDVSLLKVNNGTGKPFQSKPTVYSDGVGSNWIFVGTGRDFTSGDNHTMQQQIFFGIKEDLSLDDGIELKDMVNTSGFKVYTDDRVFNSQGSEIESENLISSIENQPIKTVRDLQAFIQKEEVKGWYFNFWDYAINRPDDRQKNTSSSLVVAQTVLFTTFAVVEDTGDQCSLNFNSYLYAPLANAGVPGSFAPIGKDSADTIPALDESEDDEVRVLAALPLGIGKSSTPQIAEPPRVDQESCPDGQPAVMVYVENSQGEINSEQVCKGKAKAGRKSWKEIPVAW